MTIKASLKCVPIICLLPLVITMLLPTATETVLGQSTQSDEIIVTVRPVTPVTPNLTPTDYKFETNYLLSRSCFNQYNRSIVLEIPEGAIGWGSISGYAIRNVAVFDNLGNSYTPVFKDDSVCNPNAEVLLPPLFEHRISLSFDSDQGISFKDDDKEYLLHFDFGYGRPATLSVRFPSNFTVLECNIRTLYAVNVTRHQGNRFITLKCDIQAKKPLGIYVRFLPFCTQGETKSLTFTISIPTAFPVKGFSKDTYQEVFTIPTTFSIWEISPFVTASIPFPMYSENLTIEEVWDGINSCKMISEPVERVDNTSLGYYYVNNENREVIVYPHPHYEGDFYEYAVGATFVTPPEYEPFKMEAIKEDKWLPFRYSSCLIIDEVLTLPHWKLNITGNVEIKFLLPPDAEPLISESGNPIIGLEGNRPVARFVYNSPGTLFPRE